MDRQLFPLVEARKTGPSVGPDVKFPAGPSGSGLMELQVPHSRTCHLLDHEDLIPSTGSTCWFCSGTGTWWLSCTSGTDRPAGLAS